MSDHDQGIIKSAKTSMVNDVTLSYELLKISIFPILCATINLGTTSRDSEGLPMNCKGIGRTGTCECCSSSAGFMATGMQIRTMSIRLWNLRHWSIVLTIGPSIAPPSISSSIGPGIGPSIGSSIFSSSGSSNCSSIGSSNSFSV